MSRSPFFYVGDKYKLVGQLKSIFPKQIARLIEPFCGGGSVFLNTSATEYLENDNNKWMIKLHKYLYSFGNKPGLFFKKFDSLVKEYGFSASYLGINVPEELKKKHIKTHYAVFNKDAYKKARDDFNKDQNNTLLLYLLLVYGFNHMIRFNSSGDFNLPVGNVDYNHNVIDALNGYFEFARNCQNMSFYAKDYKKFLSELTFKEGDFVYLDPPYLISGSEYNKYWTEKEEKELLETIDNLNKKGVKFALSNVLTHKGKTNSILKEWSSKYNVHFLKSNYISYYDNTVKKDTTEVLITNY